MLHKVRSFYSSVSDAAGQTLHCFILSCLIALISFPKFQYTHGSGIDEALSWVFNYFADGHYKLGQHILFPHSRLAFLMYPVPMGNNVFVAAGITLLCSVLFSMNLFKLFLAQHPKNYIGAAVLLLIIHTVSDIQLMLIGLTFSYALLYHASGRRVYLAAATAAAVLGLYVKVYCGAICFFTLLSECLLLLYANRTAKPLLQALALYLLFFSAGWLVLYQSLSGSFDFLRSQAELSSDNSEAVSVYYYPLNWWLLGTGLACLALLPFLSKDTTANHFFKIMLAGIFAAWKHAFSRADTVHLSFFISFLVLVLFSFLLLMKNGRAAAVALVLICISAFRLNIATDVVAEEKEISVFKPGNLYNLLTGYKSMAAEKNKLSESFIHHLLLPDTLRRMIGESTVDVFPWNYAIIGINKLNWQPRPVIHSYAAYTGWLEKQNADHLRSANAPQFFIWEMDKWEGSAPVDGIDERYLLNDEPEMLPELFGSYDLAYKDPKYLVYKKRATKLDHKRTEMLAPLMLQNEAWTEVPACKPGAVLRAKLHIKKSAQGWLLGLLYKSEAFYISYQLSNNRVKSHRIVPKNASDGLWLYPFIEHPENDSPEPQIKRIKITCSDSRMISGSYSLQFEEMDYSLNGEAVDFLSHAFHKRLQ